MSYRKVLISLFALSSLLSSCGEGKKKQKKPAVSQYFIHGSPLVMIQGATLQKTSVFELAKLDSLQGFHLTGAMRISTRSRRAELKDWKEVEAANSTDQEVEEGSLATLQQFNFTSVAPNRYQLKSSDPDLAAWILGFDVTGEKLALTDIAGTPVQVLHYSLKDDGRAFSVLLSYNDPEQGFSLLSLVFAASDKVESMPAGIEDFSYLFNNIPLPWEAAPELSACGTFNALETETIQRSVEAWYNDPTVPMDQAIQGYPIKLTFRSEYAPFSDLNQHCLMLINDYRLENSDNFVVEGVTPVILNQASKKIVDADIFVFTRYTRDEFLATPSRVTMHEIGHFLGLGHEFKRNELGLARYPSIMGYELGAERITNRDFEAIRKLYGTFLSP